jgi:hypothetical protein
MSQEAAEPPPPPIVIADSWFEQAMTIGEDGEAEGIATEGGPAGASADNGEGREVNNTAVDSAPSEPGLAEQDYMDRLVSFYRVYNPGRSIIYSCRHLRKYSTCIITAKLEQLGGLDDLFQKYYHNQVELNDGLRQKYGADLDSAGAFASPPRVLERMLIVEP